MSILANLQTHPLTWRWQQRPGCDYLPDAVTDTTAKRRGKARRLFGDGQGIFCRLLARRNTKLYHLVLALPGGCHLYWDAPVAARLRLEDLLGEASYSVWLANSHTCRVHAHVVAALREGEREHLQNAIEQGAIYCIPIKDIRHLCRLAEYKSRPNDERAAKTKPVDLGRFSKQELEAQALDASEFYLEARAEAQKRGLKQLPRLAWTKNLPFLKPDPVLWLAFYTVVFLECLAFLIWAVLAMAHLNVHIGQAFLQNAGRNWAVSFALPRCEIHSLARGPPDQGEMQSITAATVPMFIARVIASRPLDPDEVAIRGNDEPLSPIPSVFPLFHACSLLSADFKGLGKVQCCLNLP